MGSLTKATTETFGPGGVNSTNIQNDSITNAKIASDAAIANSKLSITFPTISSLSITNGQPAVYDTETVDINGTDFTNGARVDFIDSTTNAVLNLPTVTFVSATQLRVTIPASTLTEGTDYKIRVSNPDGLAATSTGTVLYSQTVSFSTSSGSLGSVGEGESASFSVSASSNSTIAYSVTSGSLPSGLSLNSSTGAITGTAPTVAADTTSTFTITATDAESQTASRSFSITVTNFVIDNSLRFNDGDSPYLNRTFSTPTDSEIFTISFWAKRSTLSYQEFFGIQTSGSDIGTLYFDANNKLNFLNKSSVSGGGDAQQTDMVFRDVSAWYHIVIATDLSQATQSNRTAIYVNGNQVSTTTFNALSAGAGLINTAVEHRIGSRTGISSYYFDGYFAEWNFIDGQKLTASDFGETDSTTNNWIPKKYTGTYGTNGFYLDFADSGNLGDDESGNTNDFTATNLAATDQTTDTPNNNFATLNPLDSNLGTDSLFEGNLKTAAVTAGSRSITGTQAVSSGKWYFEATARFDNVGTTAELGWREVNQQLVNRESDNSGSYALVLASIEWGKRNNSSFSRINLSGFTNNSTVVGVALDLDAGTLSFYKDNVIDSNAPNFTGLSGTFQPFGTTYLSSGDQWAPFFNFGQDSSFAGLKTRQNNSDENGFGDFYYTPPSGYLALCTNNLPDVDIADPTEYFNTVTYTGNLTERDIDVGFQPDWLWIKTRSSASNHVLLDSSRGVKKLLNSNATTAEVTEIDSAGVDAFISNGFSLENSQNYEDVNESGRTYVSWNWKVNGGTTSSNTDGSITSTVQANTTAGFSIVTYTGNGSSGATIGHGLGVVPNVMIVKMRTDAGLNWEFYHSEISSTPQNDFLLLNQTSAKQTASNRWNNTAPTSSVFTVGNGGGVNTSGKNYVAYLFNNVEGYSKFGSYTGNITSGTDGTFVYTGFRPAWIMVKSSSNTGQEWVIFDSKRDSFNVATKWLYANANTAENGTVDQRDVDFLSNGFKFRNAGGPTSYSGRTYIYMAFAEAPFKSGTGATTIEGTAR